MSKRSFWAPLPRTVVEMNTPHSLNASFKAKRVPEESVNSFHPVRHTGTGVQLATTWLFEQLRTKSKCFKTSHSATLCGLVYTPQLPVHHRTSTPSGEERRISVIQLTAATYFKTYFIVEWRRFHALQSNPSLIQTPEQVSPRAKVTEVTAAAFQYQMRAALEQHVLQINYTTPDL